MLNDSLITPIHTTKVNIKQKIGLRIKNARGQERTLKDIASKTKNITVSRLSNYEQGTRSPGPEEAIELAKALGNITAAEILCVDDESVLMPDEIALLENYRAADTRGKRTISSIAESQPSYMSDTEADNLISKKK